MREGTSTLIQRLDYQQPAFWIRKVDLTFDLDPAKTLVTSKMQVERNRAVPHGPLRLHGEELNLLRVLIDGSSVSFRQEGHELIIDNAPDADFALEIGRNLVHGSDSPESAEQEVTLFFSADELVEWDRAVDRWIHD